MATDFVDQVRIEVRGGAGGAGSSSFHREKYRPKGGPDGGDGGSGGSIVLVADPQVGTLASFVRNRTYKGTSGASGGSNTKHGANAPDVELHVPVGTIVLEHGQLLADLAKPGSRYVAARGGRGGRGNTSLRSSADRNPNFAERGEPGDERRLDLELRLVADVGLLGLPNAGKSTLLRGLSNATPKVAPYPFTTLEPHLGVLEVEDERLVIADLPGLVEGASDGKGLGLRFLRHTERCSVLAAVVDLSSDAAADLEVVFGEVQSYRDDLAQRVRIVVGNKTDLGASDPRAAEAWAVAHGARFVPVSAQEGSNLDALRVALAEEAEAARAEQGRPVSFAVLRPAEEDPIVVGREADAFRVRSRRVERVVSMTPLGNPRAVRHLQRRLKALGVESALEREGAQEGDEVRIGEMAFEFYPDA